MRFAASEGYQVKTNAMYEERDQKLYNDREFSEITAYPEVSCAYKAL